MIDPALPAASWFLWSLGSLFLVGFALPLLFAPLRWARIFLWRVPADDALTVYFGRCVGAVAVALCAACLRAAPHASAHPLLFELVAAAALLLAGVHIVGALERRQPWTETAEIALYAVAAIAACWLRAVM